MRLHMGVIGTTLNNAVNHCFSAIILQPRCVGCATVADISLLEPRSVPSFVWCGYDSGFRGAPGHREAETPEGIERFARVKWARGRMISPWVKG